LYSLNRPAIFFIWHGRILKAAEKIGEFQLGNMKKVGGHLPRDKWSDIFGGTFKNYVFPASESAGNRDFKVSEKKG
jgi:hypothetical protein